MKKQSLKEWTEENSLVYYRHNLNHLPENYDVIEIQERFEYFINTITDDVIEHIKQNKLEELYKKYSSQTLLIEFCIVLFDKLNLTYLE